MKLRVRVVYKAVFENRLVQSFLRVIPGLNDLVMLGKSHFHATETHSDGSYVWDKIVIDAPATGHGIFFLKIPSVISSIISSGPMYNDAKEIDDFIKNPEKTALNLVSLPEEMPVNETLELRRTMQEEVGIPIGAVIANSVYPQMFDADEMRWLTEAAPDAFDSERTQGFVDAGRFRSQRVNMQRAYVTKLRDAVDEPFVSIPYYFTERFDFQTISKIADELQEQLDPTAAATRSAG